MARTQIGLCIVRAWMEEGSPVLRAEISVTLDAAGGIRRSVLVAGAEDVERAVREWLVEVVAGVSPPGNPDD